MWFWIRLALVLSAGALVLAGCGGSTPGAPAPSGEATASAEAAPPPAGAPESTSPDARPDETEVYPKTGFVDGVVWQPGGQPVCDEKHGKPVEINLMGNLDADGVIIAGRQLPDGLHVTFTGQPAPFTGAIVNDSVVVDLPEGLGSDIRTIKFLGRDFGANDKVVLCGGRPV
ncbi:hypothetical protein JNJ66_03205 [Candidatus Saccharibacteria bacterium]|nr:hypothetical protein [Candidatus Saccharibacteria bacterium]